jgi:uncharacterized protein
VGIAGGCVRVRLAAPAHEGKANDALARLLAGVLGVRRRDVKLVAGAAGRRKLVRVRGIDLTAAHQKLGF